MIEFERAFFKKDSVMRQLHAMILKNHKVAPHTANVLYQNRRIKDFCEKARHFAELKGDNPVYIHYDVSSWFSPPSGAQIRIESIGVYDDFIEYQIAKAQITNGPSLN